MNSLFRALAAPILLALSNTTHAAPETRRVQMHGEVYQVPTRYFQDEIDLLGALKAIPRLDTDRRELLLAIPADEVAGMVPGYVARTGRYVDDLRLLVVALSAVEVKRFEDPARFADLHDGKGSYVGRIVETNPTEGMTKVFRRVEYPFSWQVFRTSALQSSRINDLAGTWLASCLDGNSPLTSTGRIALCKAYVLSGSIALQFTTSEANLQQVVDIRRMLADMLRQWRTR